jgi:membrane protein DedA with SNARE-associated domain
MEIIANSVGKLLYEHRYIFSFLGALFEGTYIMILTGVLFKFGYFKLWALISVLIAGYFTNGLGLYLIGRVGGHRVLEKLGKKLHIAGKLLDKLEEYFKKHSFKTLLFARITYGFSIPAFIIAGSFKMRFKKFLLVSFIGAIIWVGGLLGLGYVFGASYKALGVITESITIGLTIGLFAIIILISLLLLFWLRYFIKTRFTKKIMEANRPRFLKVIGKVIDNLVNNKK